MARPKKYADDAARQAAYRERWAVKEFRFEKPTAETIERIAKELDVSESEFVNSCVKYALTNHQFRTLGLWGKRLPVYKGNPMSADRNPLDPIFKPVNVIEEYRFHVACRTGETLLRPIAAFEEKSLALAFARAYAKKHPAQTVQVADTHK